MEGRSFWIIRTIPVSFRSLLWCKYLIYFPPFLLFAQFLVYFSNRILDVPLFFIALSTANIFAVAFALTGLAIGIGALLADGIGDTLRVSLTADPVKEIEVAWEILKALGLRERGPIMIACPACGRDNVGVENLAVEVEGRSATEVGKDLAQLPEVFAGHLVTGAHELDVLIALQGLEQFEAKAVANRGRGGQYCPRPRAQPL